MQNGRLVDGVHRLKVWKDWPRVRMKIKDDYDLHAVRLIANTARRNVPAGETEQEVLKMSEILKKRGYKTKAERARKISEDTGLAESYVERILYTREPESDMTSENPPGVSSKPPLPRDDPMPGQA